MAGDSGHCVPPFCSSFCSSTHDSDSLASPPADLSPRFSPQPLQPLVQPSTSSLPQSTAYPPSLPCLILSITPVDTPGPPSAHNLLQTSHPGSHSPSYSHLHQSTAYPPSPPCLTLSITPADTPGLPSPRVSPLLRHPTTFPSRLLTSVTFQKDNPID